MNQYEPIIGLEVHVELNTKSKMFCRCSADYFGKEPNTHTCPVCLGLPGALPFINQAAIESCMKIGLALNCSISPISRFERKNYFYPDLAKGYQISQYRWPLCIGGRLQVTRRRRGSPRVAADSGQEITIRINRAHQEEDTGKLTHVGNETLVDFNRSGVPLVEIVTEPDFRDVEEVRDYAKKLQQLFRYLGVSNADMERGDMRLEANVSIRKVKTQKEKVKNMPIKSSILDKVGTNQNSKTEDKELPNYRVELKNINSFRFMVAAIEYEIKRQIAALEKGEKISQETRGWDADKKCTYLQRSKEEAHDYRYFPEPDLPELQVDRLQATVDSIRENMPELPWEKVKRFEEKFKITKAQAKILTETYEIADYFEGLTELGEKEGIEAVKIANYIINQKIGMETVPVEVIGKIKAKGAGVIEDKKELENLADQAIKENEKAVADYKAGKEAALQVIIGGVMRLSKGKADTAKLKPILEKMLKS